MFRKIIVIGSPGAGKSTFSRRLRDITSLPLYHLDMINHKPDRTTVSREEFDKRLSEILRTDKWIIDGNYQRTIEVRLEQCDTVFLMDFPLEVCLSGAAARVGTKRDDLPWVEEEFDEEFRQWIIDFPNEKLPQIYQMLEHYKDKKIVIFKSRQEADTYLNNLDSAYNMKYLEDDFWNKFDFSGGKVTYTGTYYDEDMLQAEYRNLLLDAGYYYGVFRVKIIRAEYSCQTKDDFEKLIQTALNQIKELEKEYRND